jgi:hypothetical protein
VPVDQSPAALRQVALRRSFGIGKAVVLLLVLGSLGLGIAYVAKRWGPTLAESEQKETTSPGTIIIYQNLNCRFAVPERPWLPDFEIKEAFKSLLAVKRPEPAVWLVFFARDFKDRVPGEEEMRVEAVRRLSDYLTDTLEWEKGSESQLSGLPAPRIVFRGKTESGDIAGECVMLSHHFVGYWLIQWMPAEMQVEKEFASNRERFTLANKY